MRALLILAGRRIRELSPQKENDPFLVKLRKQLREARVIARAHKNYESNSNG